MHDPDGHVIGVLGTWQDVTERKRLNDDLRASRERLQVLSRQLMSAHENERRHIARELHDEIGQALTGIKLNLNAMQRSEQDEAATLLLQDTLAIANRTLEQVRNLSLDLRPSMLDDLGLPAALRWYLDRQAQRAGFTAQFIAESSGTGVSKDVETACFRIAQECLTNIARHARARHVRMELRRRDTELELLVHDDGVGFNVLAARERATRGESMGLLGMQERVLLLDGHLEIESSASGGTRMRVRFPHVSVTPQEAR
jgi:signal transduction histidine kinase